MSITAIERMREFVGYCKITGNYLPPPPPDSDIDILVITHENDFRMEKDLIGTAFDILLETGKDISVKVIQWRE